MDAIRRPQPAATGESGPGAVGTEVGAGDVRGKVRIAPAVLFELIQLAVREVPGVVDLAAPRGVERILPRGPHATAAEDGATVFESAGIRVRLRGDHLDADVAVVIEPGVAVVDASRAIQQKVGAAAGRMLGMTVTAVNVYVADVAASPPPKGSNRA